MIRSLLPFCAFALVAACDEDMMTDGSGSDKQVSRSEMPAHCRKAAAEKFGRERSDVTTLPAEHSGGVYTVYGSVGVDRDHLFTCTFNKNGHLRSIERT